MRLTAKERVLLHLLAVSKLDGTLEVPQELAQEGVANGSCVDLRHLPQNLRPLIQEGLVRERLAHVRGIRQRRKVYSLTEAGAMAAVRLRERANAEPIRVRYADGVRTMSVAQALETARGRISLVQLAVESSKAEVLDLAALASPPSLAATGGHEEAVALENRFEWSLAADIYRESLARSPRGQTLEAAELLERIGNAFYHAAFQSEKVEDFRSGMDTALQNYSEALKKFRELNEPQGDGHAQRCDAMIALIGFWLGTSPQDRLQQLETAWQSVKESLAAFDRRGEDRDYLRTFNQFARLVVEGIVRSWDPRDRERLMTEALQCAEIATRKGAGQAESRDELSASYVALAGFHALAGGFRLGLEGPESHGDQVMRAWHQARELSDIAAIRMLPFMVLILPDGADETILTYQRALELAEQTRDQFLIGNGLEMLSYHLLWKANVTTIPDRKVELLGQVLQHTEAAQTHFSSIGYSSPKQVCSPETRYADYYVLRAKTELDPAKKRALFEKGAHAAREALARVEATGCWGPMLGASSVLTDALLGCASLEDSGPRRLTLLEDGLAHASRIVDLSEQVDFRGNTGERLCTLSDFQAMLADLAEDGQGKTQWLEEAVRNRERGLGMIEEENETFFVRKGDLSGFSVIGSLRYENSDLLSRLYDLSKESGHLKRAASDAEKAAEAYGKLDMAPRVAECCWRAGKAYDAQEEHLQAAAQFAKASEGYRVARERIPQLKDFYQDLALYMQAWSEIEQAKHHHLREEYGSARGFYEHAATLHRLSKRWNSLAPNYLAWGQVEEGEDHSRKEEGEAAIRSFQQAAQSFLEAKASLEPRLGQSVDSEERRMIDDLLAAAERRTRYCSARVMLEQAKLLAETGEYSASSALYARASEAFGELARVVESEADRRNLDLIYLLAKAWMTMTKAEAEASPEMFSEASRLFEEARGHAPNEKAKMIHLGHARFCSALEAGYRFVETRNPSLHTAATRNLENAADSYLKAGASRSSEYVRATKLLFDAYVFMDEASREKDLEKRARSYLLASKVLESSAASFALASQSGKREQVLRMLDNVRREHEFAVSLTGVFEPARVVASTAAFPAPPPSYETPVGLGGLRDAEVLVTVAVPQRRLALRDQMEIVFELTNAGGDPAHLIRLEEAAPPGFEVLASPETYRMNGRDIDLAGKQLGPLETERIRLLLRPGSAGDFVVNPTILYANEAGMSKTHRPDSLEITIEE